LRFGRSGSARAAPHGSEAVAAYREALKEFTRERAPFLWAQTQEDLALVYRSLFGNSHERHYLDDALTADDGALDAFYVDKAERLRENILAMKGKPSPISRHGSTH
jgi:hypothetical protein